MAKLNARRARPFVCSGTGGDMTDELRRLTERWIMTFCEMPVLLDAELMRRVLAETKSHSRSSNDDREDA